MKIEIYPLEKVVADGTLKPVIYGVSAFDSPAEELKVLLKEKNGGEIRDAENGYSYGFLNISVGIYREVSDAEHWATIGIGVEGYYR